MIGILKKIRSANEDANYERSYGIYHLVASGRNAVVADVTRMDGMADMGPASSRLSERWAEKYGDEASFEDAVNTFVNSYTHSETEIHQLVEGMTTPPSN